jgi:hypothetical protein
MCQPVIYMNDHRFLFAFQAKCKFLRHQPITLTPALSQAFWCFPNIRMNYAG